MIKISASVQPAQASQTVRGSIKRWLKDRLWLGLAHGCMEFSRFFFAGSPNFGPPNNIFSVYKMLRCGYPPINGRIILHDQGVPRVAEDSLLVQSQLGQHLDQPWPIFWSEHSTAQLVGSSLALKSGKRLCAESVYFDAWREDPSSRFYKLPPPTRLKGNWTSLISQWVPALEKRPLYGHWLHDALPRLAVLSEFPSDTGILVPPNLGPVQIESLKLMGLWDRCRPTREHHLEIERYFFSSPTSMIDCYNPYSIRFLRDTFLPKRDPNYTGPRKFFFRRTSKHRPLENNDEVCAFFEKKGWAVVKDLDLDFAQTIKLFSEADMICSMVGSNMSNVMFCKPGCTVMHLVPDFWLDGWIDWIVQVAELNYHSAILPCRATYQTRNIVNTEWIEEFFSRSGVAF